MLVHRALLLKRSTASLFLAIFFYVLTSFGIGVYSFFQKLGGRLTFLFFIIGMVCLLLGVLYAYWEIRISHTTIVEEIKETADLIKKGPAD
jgi:1,4-dihydroxy-2-naphthoate octaprenyltransferase